MTSPNWIRKPKVWAGAALVATGLSTGAILGSTLTAGAATSGSTSSGATGTAATGAPPGGGPAGGAASAFHGLQQSGTVTAVGTNSVTISGTTYAVTSSSDIDKNGEATLANLAVGDAVTFSTVSGASTPTIDKLHAGNEALDRPMGPPNGGPPPAGSSPSTSSASGSTGA